MLDEFDYKEPSCATCGGKEFYYPDKDAPIQMIPIDRIIRKVDECFEKNDLQEAKRLLEHWLNEARELRDKRGELEILSELVGLYRKTGEKEKALESVKDAMALCNKLDNKEDISGATILLNCATTLKAFGQAEQSIDIYKSVKKVYDKLLNKDDPKFGGFYNNFALALVDVGKVDEAIDYYNKAISIMSKQEASKIDCAVSYVNLAQLYVDLDDTKLAKDNVDKALKVLFDETIPQNGYYAFVSEKCIPAFEFFDYKKEVKILKQRIKDIYERN